VPRFVRSRPSRTRWTISVSWARSDFSSVTRSAQGAAKRFGCCHHGAILGVGEGRNLGSETATARPTVLDNFMGGLLCCPRSAQRLDAMASINVEAARVFGQPRTSRSDAADEIRNSL
jgi:hypothetical protein